MVMPSVDGETNFGLREVDEALVLFGMKMTNTAGAEDPPFCNVVVVTGDELPPPMLQPASIASAAMNDKLWEIDRMLASFVGETGTAPSISIDGRDSLQCLVSPPRLVSEREMGYGEVRLCPR
jgi:hypothetical protein